MKIVMLAFAAVIFALIAFRVLDTHVAQWAAGAMASFVASFLVPASVTG